MSWRDTKPEEAGKIPGHETAWSAHVRSLLGTGLKTGPQETTRDDPLGSAPEGVPPRLARRLSAEQRRAWTWDDLDDDLDELLGPAPASLGTKRVDVPSLGHSTVTIPREGEADGEPVVVLASTGTMWAFGTFTGGRAEVPDLGPDPKVLFSTRATNHIRSWLGLAAGSTSSGGQLLLADGVRGAVVRDIDDQPVVTVMWDNPREEAVLEVCGVLFPAALAAVTDGTANPDDLTVTPPRKLDPCSCPPELLTASAAAAGDALSVEAWQRVAALPNLGGDRRRAILDGLERVTRRRDTME